MAASRTIDRNDFQRRNSPIFVVEKEIVVPTFNTFIYNAHNTVQIQKGGEMSVRFVAF